MLIGAFDDLLVFLFGDTAIGEFIKMDVIPDLNADWAGFLSSTRLLGELAVDLIPALEAGWGKTIAYEVLGGLDTTVMNLLGATLGTGTLAFLEGGVCIMQTLATDGTLAYTALSGLESSMETFLSGGVSGIAQTLATDGTLAYTALSGLESSMETFYQAVFRVSRRRLSPTGRWRIRRCPAWNRVWKPFCQAVFRVSRRRLSPMGRWPLPL